MPLIAAEAENPAVAEAKPIKSEEAEKPAAPAKAAKLYAFKDEPFFFKGSGSCEGIEFADLNKDGIYDIVSGVPSGRIHVYFGAKGEDDVSYGEKKVLKNVATGKDIFVNHW